MIGVGLQRRTSGALQDDGLGMLDVSANALAVLILATMLVISAAAPPALRGEVPSDELPPLFYPSPIDTAVAPLNRYVLVVAEGLMDLDLDGFATALGSGTPSVETQMGRATLIVDPSRYRDLNDYRLTIAPDWSAIAQAATPLAEESVAVEAEAAQALWSEGGTASTYLVSADAVEDFAPLYWQLRASQTPIRWVTVPVGRNIIFNRRSENFERRVRQWQ